MRKWLLPIVLFSHIAHASVSSDLENVFQSIGQGVNVTNPQHYQGQRAGFYTGGSLFTRSAVREYSLVHAQLPDIKAGCGGIDLFTGGFSFIKSQELVNAFKNVANNAASYSFLLGLETVSPLIKNIMVELQDKADAINRLNINSCQTSQLLVGGLWPKTEEASRTICESIGASENLFADRVAARHGCSQNSKRQQVINKGKKDDDWKDLIIDDTNIAWVAIQKNNFYKNDKQLSEFLLSLSGSIILKKGEVILLPSLIDDPQLLQALLFGGELSLYHCDTQVCLNPSKTKTNISVNQGLVSQIRALLERLSNHIQTDTEPKSQDIAFLESINLPVYKMLAVEAAFYGDTFLLNLTDYADVLALDLLFFYLNENLRVLERSLAVLQYPEPIIEQYKNLLLNAKRTVNEKRQQLLQTKSVNTQLVEKTRVLEQMLAGQLTNDLANAR